MNTEQKIDHLPESLVKELNFGRSESISSRLTRLFKKTDKELSLNEILIAYYEEYGETLRRRPLSMRLSVLTSEGVLVRVKQGVFKRG